MKRLGLFFGLTLLLISTYFQVLALAEGNYFTNDRVNFRSGPSTEAGVIATLNHGTGVELIDNMGDGWSLVKHGETNGYIKTEFLAEGQPEAAQSGTVEYTPWSEAKTIFTVGVPAKVLDVRTGLVYYVKSFSNGLHADVEPITKEDTAIMLKTYGGNWAWDPRPVWVTINGRTMAASINGMPHGGGVNPNNGMNGQVCIHFKGSTTHNSNSSFAKWHQDVALEAYNASK